MKQQLIIGLLTLVAYSTTYSLARIQAADNRIDVVKDAITRSICREVYWQNARYRLAASVSLEVKFEGEKFYAWVNDMVVGRNSQVSYFYEGRIKNGKGAIIFVTGHNLASPSPRLLNCWKKNANSRTI